MSLVKLIKFDFMNILRSPMLVLMNTLFPLILFLGFGLVTGGKFAGGYVSSWDYYGVSTMIFSGIMISMTVTNTFMEKGVIKGNIRVVYSPVSKTAILLSKLIATYIFGSIIFNILSLIEQFLFHSNFGGTNIAYVLLLNNVLTLFSCCFGTLICCIFKSEERANAVTPIIALLFVAFGGIFSPIGHFGKILSIVANISPVRWVTECAFKIIYSNNFSLYMPTISILLIVSIICIVISQFIFKPEEYL